MSLFGVAAHSAPIDKVAPQLIARPYCLGRLGPTVWDACGPNVWDACGPTVWDAPRYGWAHSVHYRHCQQNKKTSIIIGGRVGFALTYTAVKRLRRK